MEKDVAEKYNAFTTAGGNVIWGGALSLAWNDFKTTFKLKKIELLTEDPHILALTHNFNQCPFKASHIAEDSLYIKTGYGPQTVKEINANIIKKFPKANIGKIDFKLAPTDIIAYAYLSKAINFKVKFDLNSQNGLFFNGKPVRSFQARSEAQKKQVICHQYQSLGEFTVHIPDAAGKDLLFLIKAPNQLTVDEAINHAIKMEKKTASPLTKHDFFGMPSIELNCDRILSEFKGIPFANNQLKDYILALVMQKIKLNIDEHGAVVENMGAIIATKTKALHRNPIIPKYIILDRTFWIVMKQPSKHPYFCAMIKTPIQ